MNSKWAKIRKLYSAFAIDGRKGKALVELLWDQATQLKICDPQLEQSFVKAYTTGNMVDVEYAKELFHSRLKKLPHSQLAGVDPHTIFQDTSDDSRRHPIVK
jgi:hypothetical protein